MAEKNPKTGRIDPVTSAAQVDALLGRKGGRDLLADEAARTARQERLAAIRAGRKPAATTASSAARGAARMADDFGGGGLNEALASIRAQRAAAAPQQLAQVAAADASAALPAVRFPVGSNLGARAVGELPLGVTSADIARTTAAARSQLLGSSPLALGPGSSGGALVPARQALARQIASEAAGVGPAATSAMRTAAPLADDLLVGIGSSADDALRTAAVRNAATKAALGADDVLAAVGAAPDLPGVTPATRGLAAYGGTKALLGRAAGAYGLYTGGQMLGGLVDRADIGGDNSGVDRVLRNAAVGAGAGAGLGLLAGPLAPVTTPVAALIGAGVGALGFGAAGGLWGDDDTVDDVAGRFAQTLSQTSLSPAGRGQLMDQFRLLAQGQGAAGARKVADALSQQAAALIAQEREQANSASRQLAMQGMLQPLFAPYLDAAAEGARLNYQHAMASADLQPDPTLAAIYRSRAANAQQQALNTTAGYAAQMANPQMAAELQALGGYQQQVAAQVQSLLAGQQARQLSGVGTTPLSATALLQG